MQYIYIDTNKYIISLRFAILSLLQKYCFWCNLR